MEKHSKSPIIAIDGPSGSGKTTVARLVAEKLGFRLVDTGALYRSLALAAVWAGVDADDEAGLRTLAESLQVRFEKQPSGQAVFLDNQDVTDSIRTPEISQLASKVSVFPGVRHALLTVQRKMGRGGAVVFEGRDVGTVVFPDAQIKVFLTASSQVRAERRYNQLKMKNPTVELSDTVDQMQQRDERDTNRVVAPLKPAEDAVLLDTSNLDAHEVSMCVITLVERSMGI